MDSTGLLRAVRRHARPVVLVLAASVLLAAAVAALLPRTYSGRATLFLRVSSVNTSLYQRSQFAMQRIQSYPALIEAPDVLRTVRTQLDLTETSQQLADRLTAESTAGTLLLTVSATASTPQQAATIANAAASALATHVNDLENSQNTTKNAVMLVPQVAATPPSAPTTPNVPGILGLGVLAGIAAGLLAAIALERFRPRLRDADDVRRVTGLPLLAQVPAASESMQEDVADNLRTLGRGRLSPVQLVLTAGAGSHGALVAETLSRGLAEQGARVFAIVPGTASTDDPGLQALLDGSATAERVLQTGADGVDRITEGDVRSSADLPRVITPLVADHDVTVLASSVRRGLDLDVVGPFSRTAIVVVSRRTTSEHDVLVALAALRSLEVLPIGVVLTDGPRIDSADLATTWRDGDFLRIELEAASGVERIRIGGRDAALAGGRRSGSDPVRAQP